MSGGGGYLVGSGMHVGDSVLKLHNQLLQLLVLHGQKRLHLLNPKFLNFVIRNLNSLLACLQAVAPQRHAPAWCCHRD